MRSNSKQEAYRRRPQFLRNKEFEVTEDIQNYFAYQDNEIIVFQSFEDIRCTKGHFEVRTRWRGFGDSESSRLSVE